MRIAAVSKASPDFFVSAKAFAASVARHVGTRLELLAIEVAEEKNRLVVLLIAAALTVCLIAMSVAFLATFVLVYFWDTDYRLHVAGAIVLVFVAAAVASLYVVRQKISRPSELFSGSLAELRKDTDLLGSR